MTATMNPAPQAPAKKKAKKWPWVLGGSAVFLVVVGSINPHGSAGSALPSSLSSGSISDVVVTNCQAFQGPLAMPSVTVRITNSTNRTQSYWVTASINNAAGDRLAEANGASNSVLPGQSANAELLAGGVDLPSPVTCVVANVTRLPL